MNKQWKVAERRSDDVVEQLLLNRRIKTEDREDFLHPRWEDVLDPSLFRKMQDAVDRVFLALERGDKIVVHGDYDADGVCGSALLWNVLHDVASSTPGVGLRGSALDVEAYLPDRERDGYGVVMHTIDKLHRDGVNLIITVDCGTSNASELNRAHELGMDVIICDHHQLASDLPARATIIHPLLEDAYPNKDLCGTGVAFKFATALIREARKRGADLPDGHEKWYLDLVAIATVTDVMPITGENRALEKFGLVVLNKTRRPGLKKIIESSRTKLGEIDTQAIGFRIGPRLNAAGRMSSAEIAFKTLIATDDREAADRAAELEILNRERQKATEVAYAEAREMVVEDQKCSVYIVWSEVWAPGIVGLVAGKLVSEFGVPAFALTKIENQFVGSGRSAGGLHLVEAMHSCGDIFIKAGGHPQACGLSLATLDHVEQFRQKVTEFADEFFGINEPQSAIEIDAELPLGKIDWELYETLQRFAPFGKGNPKPLFVARGLQVMTANAVGKEGKHLKLSVNPPEGSVWNMIAFGFGKWAKKLNMGDMIDVVYEINVNEWNGNRSLQGHVVDLRISEELGAGC
ncbi:MAG: single-stranded-DNA-specific exonuclease RecJ [bacterium]